MSELDKLAKEDAEKAKSYKSMHDPERVFYLISACNIMKDMSSTTALSASFLRELRGMSLKQEEQDAKDQAERQKKVAEAQAADAKPAEENGPGPSTKSRQPNLADTRR